MWKRRLCAIVLLVAVLPSAQPCCGGFSEYGLENDPLTGNLERFYLHLVRPGKTLDQVTSDGETSANRALADEDAGDWTRAQDDWQEAMHGIDCESASAWRLREIRDRLDLLPVVGGMIPAALWHRYAVAAYHQTDLYRRVDVTAIAPDLLALTTDANQPIAAAALTSIAWRELQAGQMPAARAHLASAATLDPQGAKGDEIGYLQVIAPIYAHAGNGWGIDDPAGTLNAIQAWLTAHPSSPWRFHARSWQAGILYHHRELAWGQDSDGLFAAVRIWQHLLLTAQADELFVPAVESLRFAYRKMRPAPPAWVVADPRHAAAFYWHAFTDPSYGWADAPGQDLDAKRKAMLADAAPAMARFAASDADPALMEAVADTWIAAGHPEVALPLASRALGAMPSPRLRYEVARLQADAGDATAAAATIAGGAIDGDVGDPRPLPGAERFDLLVRIGGDWEIHGDWHRALRRLPQSAADAPRREADR